MVTKNFDTVVLGLDGEPQKEAEYVTDPKTGVKVLKTLDKEVTMKAVIVGVLMDPRTTNEKSGSEKIDCFKLAMKLNKGGNIDITAKQITKILEYVEGVHGPLIVGRLTEFLDPTSMSKDEEEKKSKK